MSFINNTSFMKLVSGAWERACEILHEHDHVTRPPDVEVLFMEELGKLDHDISHIVAMIYSNYTGTMSELLVKIDDYDKLQDQCIGYQRERNKLKTTIRECQDEKDQLEMRLKLYRRVKKEMEDGYDMLLKANTKQIELSNDLLDQRDDLESSLNTSRYFIFLSGMCGFVLGLACLYFVV